MTGLLTGPRELEAAWSQQQEDLTLRCLIVQ
jgi:hypothetical protein